MQSQQLQMLPMSNPTISPGAVETQQMRVIAPVGVGLQLPPDICANSILLEQRASTLAHRI